MRTLIIGSGVAAAAVAKRLLAFDRTASIVMLEAGQRVRMQDAAIWQDYVIYGSSKLPYKNFQDQRFPEHERPGENSKTGSAPVTLDGARVMTYGGSTIHWGGWAFRMKPEDFRLKSATGIGVDWPYSYDVLEPYYGQAEHYLGVSGDSRDTTVPRSEGSRYPFPHFPYTLEDQPVAEAMSKLGITHSHLPIARRGVSNTASRHAPCQTTGTCKYCPFGARFSANNYLDEMVQWGDYPNLQIFLGRAVQQILLGARNQAVGVVYVDKTDGSEHRIEADRIIVAAGAIESAKLLQRSGTDLWAKGIGNDAEMVGANIVTHPFFMFPASLPKNPGRLQPQMDFPTLVSRHFDNEKEQPKGKFIFVHPAGSPNVKLIEGMRAGKTRADLDASIEGPTTVQIHGMIEVFSEAKNRISNMTVTNFASLLQTQVHYDFPGGFNERMKEIRAQADEIFKAMGATPLPHQTESWRADHAGCTVRMHDDPALGVTDRDMKVHGVDNLYVCSNGAFPNIGAVNPTLTLTALALKLGDHLANLGAGGQP